jgi:hypothetical protein
VYFGPSPRVYLCWACGTARQKRWSRQRQRAGRRARWARLSVGAKARWAEISYLGPWRRRWLARRAVDPGLGRSTVGYRLSAKPCEFLHWLLFRRFAFGSVYGQCVGCRREVRKPLPDDSAKSAVAHAAIPGCRNAFGCVFLLGLSDRIILLPEYLHRDWHEDDSQQTYSDKQPNR